MQKFPLIVILSSVTHKTDFFFFFKKRKYKYSHSRQSFLYVVKVMSFTLTSEFSYTT